MNKINYYKLKIKEPVNKNYYSLLRYMIQNSENYWAPEKISYDPDLQEQIEGEIFANRLGLIMFRNKQEVLEKDHEYQIINDTQEIKKVYSSDFENDFFEPLDKKELLMLLKPKSAINLNIHFEIGNGVDHARFSKIEGFSFKDNQGKPEICFELTGFQFEPIWQKVKTNIDNLIQE